MDAKRICSVCRVTQLSRYNNDSVCTTCLRANRSNTREVVPQWLWDSAPLRRALANLDLGAALALIRTSSGLSQIELATIIGWEQSAVARAENGSRDTLYDIRKLLAVADALDMPREALAPLLLGTPTATITHTEDDMDRRQFGGSLLGLTAATVLNQLQVPLRVDNSHIRYLHATLDRLYRQDQQVGGAGLARGALRQFYRARRMLDEADYSEQAGRELMTMAGDLAVCVGWLSYDTDNQTLTRQLYSEALLLANEADDDALKVRVMEKMSLQAVHLARKGQTTLARQAVRLAERAFELVRRDRSPRLHALIAAREAIGYATLGDSRNFNTAITRAWREIDRGAAPNDPTWLQFVTPQEIRIHEARGQTFLGNHPTAARLYRESLADPDLPPRNCANYRALLAAALADEGDQAGAISEGIAVLPALEQRVSSPRTLHTLAPVRVAAEQLKAKEFCLRYDTILQGT